MKKALIIIILLLVVLTGLTSAGCSRVTGIGDLLDKTSQYEGKEVTIKGTVGETTWFALVEKGAYQLGDGSGTIWVITSQPPPQKGQSISTRGEVKSAFSIEGQSYGTALVETKRN